MLPGLFAGNVLHARSGWTGDLPIADGEDPDTCESISDFLLRRFSSSQNEVSHHKIRRTLVPVC